MSTPVVRCDHLTKTFNHTPAVQDLSLTVARGEILALLGPSGCGKTTTLRLLAGLERPDAGQIAIGEQVVAGPGAWVPPEKRGLGMVFQDHALFPHLTAHQNVAFGLRGLKPARVKEKVDHLLELVGLGGLAERYPHELSGGERQRVALARALAPEPVFLLFDEPFSSLDADRRAAMREQVRAILRSLRATAIFVTHDQEEALFLGDRIAILHHGRLEQVDTPEIIFHSPATRFVAEFLGHTDFLPGEVAADGILTEIGLIPQRLALPVGAPVELALRADDVALEPSRDGARAFLLARHFKGAQSVYRVRLPSGRLLHSLQPHTLNLRPGTPVRVRADAGHPLACFHAGRRAPGLEG